jgi:hypothetical protein
MKGRVMDGTYPRLKTAREGGREEYHNNAVRRAA